MLYAVGELRNEMIVAPSTSVHPKIQHSKKWNPFLKVRVSYFTYSIFTTRTSMLMYLFCLDCVGAIDGTHVLARVTEKHRAAFMGRKHTHHPSEACVSLLYPAQLDT